MSARKVVVRSITLIAAVCCLSGSSKVANAQSPSAVVNPGSLTFGVITVGQNASQNLTFTVTSDSAVNVTAINITGAADFTETDNCLNSDAFSFNQGCTVTVRFAPTVTGPQTAQLVFQTNGVNPPAVPLNGGIPFINLFGPLFVNATLPNTLAFPGTAVATNSVTLSCPANPIVATLSSTPNGSGFVFQDNYIRVTPPSNVQIEAAVSTDTPSGVNVCTGGTNDGGFASCFQHAYEGVAPSFVGKNPDTAGATADAPPNSSPTFVQTFGVAPIDISGLLTANTTQTVKFELVDVGPPQPGFFLGSSTLDLLTNCTQTSVAPGGTVTTNPINPGDAGSLVSTLPFDATQGQHIAFTINYSQGANNGNQVTIQPDTVAHVTNLGIRQADFFNLVQGTSAGPAICLRHTGEVDPNTHETLCKAYVLECTNSGTADGASDPAGANCGKSALRNLLYEGAFDSLDFPPGSNPIAPFTGPGLLMGPDVWPDAAHCTFTNPELQTQLCPQDTLTEFFGAADPVAGGTARTTNSTFVPVINMPLPLTLPLVLPWQHGTLNVNFLSSPAIYIPTPSRPAHGFRAAPLEGVTFGVTPANQPVPEPTFPVPGDNTLFNGGSASQCPSAPGGLAFFHGVLRDSLGNPVLLPEGRYNLHFFATDCASTEELNFKFSNNPTTNWAQFKTVPVTIDNTPPVVSTIALSPANPSKGQKVTASFSCSDPGLANGTQGPGSGVALCGPYIFAGAPSTKTLTVTFTAGKPGVSSFSVTAADLAGNTVTKSINY